MTTNVAANMTRSSSRMFPFMPINEFGEMRRYPDCNNCEAIKSQNVGYDNELLRLGVLVNDYIRDVRCHLSIPLQQKAILIRELLSKPVPPMTIVELAVVRRYESCQSCMGLKRENFLLWERLKVVERLSKDFVLQVISEIKYPLGKMQGGANDDYLMSFHLELMIKAHLLWKSASGTPLRSGPTPRSEVLLISGPPFRSPPPLRSRPYILKRKAAATEQESRPMGQGKKIKPGEKKGASRVGQKKKLCACGMQHESEFFS